MQQKHKSMITDRNSSSYNSVQHCNTNTSLSWQKRAYINKKNLHFLRNTPDLESRRNAWLELFKTEDDLWTDCFLCFKNSKALCKHWGGPISLKITCSKLQIKIGVWIITGWKATQIHHCILERMESLTSSSLISSSLTW